MVAPVVRAVVRPLSTHGSIICFHSVTEEGAASASSAHVPLATLEWAVAAGRQQGHVVPLMELVARHQAGKTTAGLVAITFDDAYAALLHVAGEYLRDAAVPVTIFATNAAARTGASYWWDRVEDAYANVSEARRDRFVRACGLPTAYIDGASAEYGPFRPLRQWILRDHHGRWPASLSAELSALEQDAGVRTAQRSLTYDEIRSLRKLGPIDIGIHTVSHPVLPLLTSEEIETEIVACHRELREHFGSVLPVLALPFGLYDRRTCAVARRVGMAASLTLGSRTLRGVASGDDLPRFCIMREERAWKFRARILGVGDRLQGRAPSDVAMPPDLPSATT
jgi:peptidoglycan/xylan/chitin deacetylase (PgdA/CDA1 family)